MTTTTPGQVDLTALWEETRAAVADALAPIEWAENEIERATHRRPDQADVLYHAFPLLQPRPWMRVEFVYRSHARELLDRLAAGQDTRPATAAELCWACCQASQEAPLTTTAAGLYFRAWAEAFPDSEQPGGDAHAHYEAIRGPEIDDLERQLRRHAGDPKRRLRQVDCDGRHHGEQVACHYAKPTADLPEQEAS
jgi:hypothetical protein